MHHPTTISPSIITKANKHNIHYIQENDSGIYREGSKDSFRYRYADGTLVKERDVIDRITSLRIPPAWTDVWISPDPMGHLQATGKDAKYRKQYLYHPEWNKITQEHKFDKIELFGEKLPLIREQVKKDLSRYGLPEEKVLATVVWLLEHTFVRIGNKEYAKENNSFGLTTLRNKHVDVHDKTIKFHFIGKSGIEHNVNIHHRTVAKTIRQCVELPGYKVFQYLDKNKNKHAIDSSEVNTYLRDITHKDITAKDFRTWGGTMTAAITLYDLGPQQTKKEKKKKVTETVKTVAKRLGNTPTISRNYYIHPAILKAYEEDTLIPLLAELKEHNTENSSLKPTEHAVLKLLQKYPAEKIIRISGR